MRRQLPSTTSSSSNQQVAGAVFSAFCSSILTSTSRFMRIKNSNTSSTSSGNIKPMIAQVSNVSRPVKLSDDYTPFPLPRYDDIGGLEPSPVKSTSYDAERMMSKRKQLLLDEMFPSTSSTAFDEALVVIDRSKSETGKDALSSVETEVAAAGSSSFFSEDIKYTREPSENPRIFDRNFCLRSVPDLVESLKAPHPNIHRNVAALNDITDKIQDFLNYAKRDMTSFGLEDELKLYLERIPEEDVETRELVMKVFSHRRDSHETCLNDFLLVGKTLRQMFIGGSLALNFRKFRISNDTTIPTWENERTARVSFLSFFGHAQTLMTDFVMPVLSTAASSASTSSSYSSSPDSNGQQILIESQKFALLLECVTEFLRLLAHFQLLDHERHFTNYAPLPSAKLTNQQESVQRNFWTSKSGLEFLDQLSMLLMIDEETGINARTPRFSPEGDESSESSSSSSSSATIKFSQLFSVIPTKTLSEWFFFYTSSYMRLDNWLARHVEFSQAVSTELVQNRLLPACKRAFGMSKGKDASALFLDSPDADNDAPPLLGLTSGVERSRLISDLLVSCAIGDITLPSDFLEEALLDGALAAATSSTTVPLVTPNFFIGMVKLFGGAKEGCVPLVKMFKLMEIEFLKFRSGFERVLENSGDGSQEILKYQHQEHDWISAIYEVVFATEERATSLHFLQQINFTKGTLLKHIHRFADPNGVVDADFNADEVGIYDDDLGEVVERDPKRMREDSASSMVTPLRLTSNGLLHVGASKSDLTYNMNNGDSEFYSKIEARNTQYQTTGGDGSSDKNTNNKDVFFPTYEEVQEKTQSILQQSLLPGAKNNKELVENMLTNDELTVASSRIPKARTVFVLHTSFLAHSNNDGLREIIERCHGDHALLVIPSYTLFQLAAFTADTGSRSGRLAHEDLKKESLQAIFTELVNGRAFIVSPEEEVVIRFHEGHADADTLIWETCSFLQTRAPMTAFYTLVDVNHRAARKLEVFGRPLLASERHAGQKGSSQDRIGHPLLKHVDHDTLHKHMRRSVTGGPTNDAEPFHGDEAAGKVWKPEVAHYVPESRFATQRRVFDPRGQAFMLGQFWRGGRGDLYANHRMSNLLPDADGKVKIKRNILKGHHKGRLYEDFNGLGVYAPDHVDA